MQEPWQIMICVFDWFNKGNSQVYIVKNTYKTHVIFDW